MNQKVTKRRTIFYRNVLNVENISVLPNIMKGKTRCPQCNYEFVMDIPDNSEMHKIVCPKCSNSFVIKKSYKEKENEECGWEEHGEPRKTILSSLKKRTNKPIIASFLLLTTGILGIFTAVIYGSMELTLIPELQFVIDQLSTLNIDHITLSFAMGFFSICAFLGSITAFLRKYLSFTIICAFLSIFSIGLFIGIALASASFILILYTRDEFENATKGKVF